jgi:hypothetical protein
MNIVDDGHIISYSYDHSLSTWLDVHWIHWNEVRRLRMMEFNPLPDRCVGRGCSSSLPSVVVHIYHPLLSPPDDPWSWILCCFRLSPMHRPTHVRCLVFYSKPAARFQPSVKDVSSSVE